MNYLPFLHDEQTNNNAILDISSTKVMKQTSVLTCRQSNTLLLNRLVNRRTKTKNRSKQQQRQNFFGSGFVVFLHVLCCFALVSLCFGSMFIEDNIHLLHCQTPKQVYLHLKTHHNFFDKQCSSPHLRPLVEELPLDELDCNSY